MLRAVAGVAASVKGFRGGQAAWETSCPLAMNQPMPVPADEPSKLLRAWFTSRPATGVQSLTSWPCGQDSQPKPGSHQRRFLRHEA